MELRYYQTDLLAEAERQWAMGRRRVLLMAPTGAGKTPVLAEAINRHPGSSCAIAHRDNLVIQLSMSLAALGVRHRVIASQKTQRAAAALQAKKLGKVWIDPGARCAVASAQTLAKRDDLAAWCAAVTLWIVDEAHHAVRGGVWGTCIDRFTHPQCVALLPTATPGRADGKGLGSHHDGYADVLVALVEDGDRLGVRVALPGEVITCAPARVLIAQGFLTPYKVALAESHMTEFLGEVAASGDWSQAALKSAARQSTIIGDVVTSYRQFADGLTGITFAPDVETAGDIAKAYRAGGVSAEVLTGETDPTVRMSIFARLESGALKQVVAVDVISEGTDIPAVGVITFARPTASLGLFLQMLGRGLRLAEGKTCLLRGTPVLTQRGLVPIQDVTLTDRVWDGISFVEHKGAVCNGIRPVITYLGLTATPDHLVWTAEGWRAFGDCAREQVPIAQTGFGGNPIWERDRLFAVGGVAKVETVRILPVPNLLRREVAFVHKPEGGSDEGVSALQSARAISSVVLREGSGGTTAVPEPTSPQLRRVRREGNSVQFLNGNGGGALDSGQPGNTGQSASVGSDRQRRALRAGEYPLVYPDSEHVPYAEEPSLGESAFVPHEVPSHQVRGRNSTGVHEQKHDGRGDHPEVFHALKQAEGEVWDILDAGPRNRFTAQGFLVHNCSFIIDHVGNFLRHGGGPDTPRPWSLDRRDKRAPKVNDAIPIRVCLNEDCMQPYEKHLDCCPYCGQPVPEPEKRGPPDQVDGVLALLDDDTLARLRGEVPPSVDEYSQEMYASGLPGRFAGANVKRHKERLAVLGELRDAMARWAGPYRARGETDSELQRRFYLTWGVDAASATVMSREDAQKLLTRMSEHV